MCCYFSLSTSENLSLETVLSTHALSLNIADDSDDRQNIPVRRKHIWSDTKRALSRATFQNRKGLSITFVGEPAVDGGGPLREYFRLLMLEIGNDARLFCGPEGRRTPTHNLLALQQNEYFYAGKCIALSISYGGPGPHFLCETSARYLCNEAIITPLQDVPDSEISEKLEKVRIQSLIFFTLV